jgi:hypothetical protein
LVCYAAYLDVFGIGQNNGQHWSDPNTSYRSVCSGEPHHIVEELWKQIQRVMTKPVLFRKQCVVDFRVPKDKAIYDL